MMTTTARPLGSLVKTTGALALALVALGSCGGDDVPPPASFPTPAAGTTCDGRSCVDDSGNTWTYRNNVLQLGGAYEIRSIDGATVVVQLRSGSGVRPPEVGDVIIISPPSGEMTGKVTALLPDDEADGRYRLWTEPLSTVSELLEDANIRIEAPVQFQVDPESTAVVEGALSFDTPGKQDGHELSLFSWTQDTDLTLWQNKGSDGPLSWDAKVQLKDAYFTGNATVEFQYSSSLGTLGIGDNVREDVSTHVKVDIDVDAGVTLLATATGEFGLDETVSVSSAGRPYDASKTVEVVSVRGRVPVMTGFWLTAKFQLDLRSEVNFRGNVFAEQKVVVEDTGFVFGFTEYADGRRESLNARKPFAPTAPFSAEAEVTGLIKGGLTLTGKLYPWEAESFAIVASAYTFIQANFKAIAQVANSTLGATLAWSLYAGLDLEVSVAKEFLENIDASPSLVDFLTWQDEFRYFINCGRCSTNQGGCQLTCADNSCQGECDCDETCTPGQCGNTICNGTITCGCDTAAGEGCNASGVCEVGACATPCQAGSCGDACGEPCPCEVGEICGPGDGCCVPFAACIPGFCGVDPCSGEACGCGPGEVCNGTSCCAMDCEGLCNGAEDPVCQGACFTACGADKVCDITTNTCCEPSCPDYPACGLSIDGCDGDCGCPIGEVCVTNDDPDPNAWAQVCEPVDCGGCQPDEICLNNLCFKCEPECAGKGCHQDNGCGEPCGCDDASLTCDPSNGGCVDAASACDGKLCGQINAFGVACDGACPSGEMCVDSSAGFACECAPSCDGQLCGQSDGCGGTCTDCPDQHLCDGGTCVCQPDCNGKSCGEPDGCGGTCQACPGPQDVCMNDAVCECVPACDGVACNEADGCGGVCDGCSDKECGDNGCGQSCGICGEGGVCTDAGVCEALWALDSCAERAAPKCCDGEDEGCSAPSGTCFCDEYCVQAGDCCPDACGVCGFCAP